MRLLGKRKELELTAPQEKLAMRIAGAISSYQRRIACHLNRSTAAFGQRKWLVLLIVFCLLMGIYCSYLVIIAFN